jgi:RNA polymerase sigma-70 factor, ECF subfamily
VTAAEPPDHELLRRHTGGDADAFGTLFARHRDRLWAVAVRTLGDPEEAADALQEAMISAFRQAGGFRGDAAVTTWLHRIVVNACLDRMRRRAARPVIGGLDERVIGALAPRPRGGEEQADTAMDVTAAMRALPLEQRAALVLVDMLGYPVADAAGVLGVSPGTVKSRCARGRARLLPLLSHLRRPAPPGTRPDGPGSGHPGTAGGGHPGTAGGGSPGSAGGAPPGAGTGPPGNRAATGRVSPAEGGETRR